MEGCREDQSRGEEVERSVLKSPCSSCPWLVHKAVEAIFKCLGLESSTSASSSSSEEDDPRTEMGEETGVLSMIARLVRRRPRPRVTTGPPGQVN